ncbi:MAG: AraC family transcriptional regulator [Myxococcales bacterium]|nr:AraC family transcriptional regulator [Myxococcales bacterium]
MSSSTLSLLAERVSRLFPAGRRASPESLARTVDGLVILRRDRPSAFDATVYQPVMCLILCGRKQVTLGDETLSFGPGECLLVSHELPVRSRITVAPYTALVFEVDVAAVRTLYDELLEIARESDGARAAEVHRADAELLDALRRYVDLADTPRDAKVLAPLVAREIHYRLLTAPFGGMLRSLLFHDSSASAVARAIEHIRADLRKAIAVPELARRVGMSASSLHKHFRSITSTTPLQYQKELRLMEARRLLQSGAESVTSAAFGVGDERPSQFSREYARKFGVPPSRERAAAAG